MIDENAAKEISQKVIGLSTADETEVMISGGPSSLTRYSGNAITQNVSSNTISIVVRVTKDRKLGKAVTNKLDDESLKKAVNGALEITRFQKPMSDDMPMPGPQEYKLLHSYIPETEAMGPAPRAKTIGQVVTVARDQGLEAAGVFSNGASMLSLANSNGLFAYHLSSASEFSVTMASENSSGWAEASSKDINALDCRALGHRSLVKAMESRNPQKINPGEYTVILEHAASSDFLLFLSWEAFGGLGFLEGRSFLSGRLGDKVFGDNITIRDNAYNPLSSGLPFDFEGMPRQEVTLIENGIAKAVVHDRETAQKAGVASTGHALPKPNTNGPLPLHLEMDGGKSSLEEMISSTDRGILVTHFHYTNVIDPMKMILTGMTRDGTFLIEHGEVVGPVVNLRFTESVIKALNNVELISEDRIFASPFFGGGTVVPALKINHFNFSSVTEF
jgi:PmbA protein